MKKEIFAAALLAALFLGALLNIRYMEGFIGGLGGMIDESRAYCEAGDLAGAEELLRSAIDEWNAADSYTHIFIRHSEIDSASDAFYELLSYVASGDADGASGAYEKLSAHLSSLYTMERVTPGSVF